MTEGVAPDLEALEDGDRALNLLVAKRRALIKRLSESGPSEAEMNELALVQQSIDIVLGAIDEENDLLEEAAHID